MSGLVRDVRLVVLGSGTSAGVPIIACDCEVCRSEDPRDRRTRASVAVIFRDRDARERVVLIDTSPDLREQAIRERLQRCDAIVYTHDHVDHTFGLDEVRRFNAVMKASIDVWAEAETMESLLRVYRHIFRKESNTNISFVASLVPRLIDPARPIDLFGIRFTPLRLFHGNLPVLGFRLDALDEAGRIAAEQPSPLPLAYCTDVSRIPDGTWCQLGRLRHLVLDLLRYKPHPTHFSAEEAVDAAERIAAEHTWFTHMTHDVRHADLDARLPEDMALAWDGLTLE